MGWDMFSIALAIQTSWLVSDPYAFQVEDLLLKEDVVVWLEELVTNDPYPSKGVLCSAFKEAVLTYVVWMDWKNRNVSPAWLPNVSKGQQVHWQLIPPRASASTRKRRGRRRTSACNA